MKSKAAKLLVLLAVISAIVMGGIHLGFRSEVTRLESRLDFAMIDYQQAVRACSADALECAEAEYRGDWFDRTVEDLDEAKGQASLFLVLALGVPASLLIMALGVRRLTRSRGNMASDESAAVLT